MNEKKTSHRLSEGKLNYDADDALMVHHIAHNLQPEEIVRKHHEIRPLLN